MPCLTRDNSKKFLDAIRNGTITPAKMLWTTSKDRQVILAGVIGKENAGWVNAALEEKLLLKDQKRGMVTWAKKVGGITPAVRQDLLSMIQKNDRVFDPATANTFLESLAAKKLGHEITFAEAKQVSDFANRVKVSKGKIAPSEPIRSTNRLAYGGELNEFRKYVSGLKHTAGKQSPFWYVRHPLKSLYYSAGAAKSFLSTLDNSYFGRQGIKMLFTNPDIWTKGFLKSWRDIGRELIGIDAMDIIKADIYSRPNAINGNYDAMRLDIGIGAEEPFPSQVLTKIPGLGRIPRAAESAFNGAALRFRADYADRLIKKAEKQGVDISDPLQAEPIGRLVNSMTGRGKIPVVSEKTSKVINATIFSIKFLKSNFDTLTAHQFQKGVTPFVRREAALNLLKIAGSLAGIYTTANLLSPGSAELDPRSSKFGKVKSGDTTFDPSGGMASLVTLAARLIPTVHNGKLGWYMKTRDGEIRELGTGKYGTKNPLDIFYDFTEGKFAPYAALLRDLLKGIDPQGHKTYVKRPIKVPGVGDISRVVPNVQTIARAHTPIPAQNFVETMNDPKAAPLLLTTILDGLGIGTTTYSPPEKPLPTTPQQIKSRMMKDAGIKRPKTRQQLLKEILEKQH